MFQHLDWIDRPRNVYWLAVKDCRKNSRHTPAHNNGFGNVYCVSEPCASSEQAEVEEEDRSLDGSNGDRVVYLAGIDILADF